MVASPYFNNLAVLQVLLEKRHLATIDFLTPKLENLTLNAASLTYNMAYTIHSIDELGDKSFLKKFPTLLSDVLAANNITAAKYILQTTATLSCMNQQMAENICNSQELLKAFLKRFQSGPSSSDDILASISHHTWLTYLIIKAQSSEDLFIKQIELLLSYPWYKSLLLECPSSGNTPLEWALKLNIPGVVKVLLAHDVRFDQESYLEILKTNNEALISICHGTTSGKKHQQEYQPAVEVLQASIRASVGIMSFFAKRHTPSSEKTASFFEIEGPSVATSSKGCIIS